MLYDAYEVQRSFLAGASKWAGMSAGWLNNPANPFAYASMSPLIAAALDVFAHAAAPRGKPEFGIKHTTDCLKMPECVQTGYGVLTDDKKIVAFDAAGNEQAKKFIQGLTKSNDIKVTVTGTLNGDRMTVSKIDLL